MAPSPEAGSESFPEARFYRLAMESLPDMVFVATEDGSLLWACPNVTATLGLDADAVVETETVASVLSPEMVSPLDPDERQVENRPVIATDADDGERHLLVTVTRITVDEGSEDALLYACRDVTDVERLESELDEVFDRVTDGFFSVDRDLRIEYANAQFARTLGRDPEELVGEYLWDVVDDAETLEAFELLPEALESGEPTTYQGHYEPADVWYEVSVYPSETGLSIYSKDVTDRVERERQLRTSESRFRALFERTLDALVLADDEGRYVDVNPAACDLYGLPREELLGKTAADFATEEFDFEAAWEAFLDTGQMRGEFELVRPDGEVRVTEFTAQADIRPGEHLSVLRDVTDRVERERQLEVQRDELARLAHINRLVQEVNRAVVGADTRTEVLSDVCRRLVAADVYRHALIASETASGRFEVVTAAGLSTEAVEATLAAFEGDLATAARRVTSVVGPPPAHLRDDGHVATDVFGCFPLAYAGTVHGVLLVGADRDGDQPVFVGGEQQVLDDLGATVGKAITAVTARRLLHVDEVVTLEFAVGDTDDVFNQLSNRLAVTVSVTALVPIDGGRHTCYLAVTDEGDPEREWDADAVRRTVEAIDAVEGCRLVATDGTLRLEVQIDGGSPALDLETQGAHIRTLSATAGRGRLVVEVPTESNVRSLVAGLTDDYPGTALVRKLRERRSGETAGEIGGRQSTVSGADGTASSLTERQLAALRAAHAGGYYDWPRRGSSAQELAGALDVAPATYHQHLRAAERKLVEAFFRG